MSEHGKSSSDDTLWVICIVVGIVIGLGWWFDDEIKGFYLTIKLIQLKFITLVLPIEYYTTLIPIIENKAPGSWKINDLITVGTRVGYITNIPLIAILGWFTYKIYSGNPVDKFKRQMNMKSLKASEQRLWPYIAPVVSTNILEKSMTEYAMDGS